MTVVSGDKKNTNVGVEKLLTLSKVEVLDSLNTNFWMGPNGASATFILSLGCKHMVSGVRIVNTHNGHGRNRASKQFRNERKCLLLKYIISLLRLFVGQTASGPWTMVFGSPVLDDSRQQQDPLPLQIFPLDTVTAAQFIKFELLAWYGPSGGLQFFDILRED